MLREGIWCCSLLERGNVIEWKRRWVGINVTEKEVGKRGKRRGRELPIPEERGDGRGEREGVQRIKINKSNKVRNG